jgi:GNAT superfamily N-acetyltransferase
MSDLRLRAMRPDEFDAVADLICISTNYWYESQRGFRVFPAGPRSCRLFPEVYDALDPGCCVVAEDSETGRLIGSCFYHPRETHVSLGIMNVHPNYFGRRVASRLLQFVIDFAERAQKPVRLVSSAMNLDSFSLYTRAGFVPRAAFADMALTVPLNGPRLDHPDLHRVRAATPQDVPAMAALEEEVAHILREKDYRFFIENRQGIWNTFICESPSGAIDGFLVSVHHPGSHMLGPGAMRTDEAAAALIATQLNHHAGRSPIFLVPLDRPALHRQVYQWGGKNVEIHFAQVRGTDTPPNGVVMPTFMPETG